MAIGAAACAMATAACQRVPPRRDDPPPHLATADSATTDSVLAVWDVMNAAWARGDTVTVGRVFAPELRAATAAGRLFGRDAILKYIAAAGSDTGAAAGWKHVFAHESFVRPSRALPASWHLVSVPQSAPVAATTRSASTPVRLTVQNRYYARDGMGVDVYRWRVHASSVLRQLGLTPGVVYRGAGGSEPDAVWEVTLDSAALMREGAIANASPAFQAVMQRMGELIRRFETTTSRETRHFVEVSGSRSDGDAVGTLERAARAWIAGEEDAFARRDAAAFQPCRDSTAVVLVDVDRASHACIAVQRHMRDRMAEMESGAMRVRIDSVIVCGDTGLVYEDVHFQRTVRHTDGSVHQHASDVLHRDVWRRDARSWDLLRMEELDAPAVTIDGRPAATAATASGIQAPSGGHSYLFVWTGGRGASEFMATVDADPASATYGRVLAVAPTGVAGMPHHTEHELAASGHLLANDFHAGRTYLFDLCEPLRPTILGSFGDVAGYSHPHTFIRMGDGRVLSTFQYRADSSTSAMSGMMSMHVTSHATRAMPVHATGGLVLMDERGNPVMSGSAVDTHISDRLIYPYSVLPLRSIDRALSTTTDMDHDDTVATSEWVQLWRLSDLTLLKSFALPPGPRGVENRFSGEPRLLADGRSVYVHTFNCGLYLVRGIEHDEPTATFVHGFEGDDCGVPILTGHYWLQTVPAMHGVVVLDVADPAHPREVSRVSVGGDESPHWIGIDHTGRRVVLNSGGRGNRLFILDFDPATGAISVDQRFRDAGSDRAGIALSGAQWPAGFVGNVVPHGAVFSR